MNTYRVRDQERKYTQQGMAAIFVTMIMMIVISLIVLGFAQVSRRESRDSLDRQLSTQAYFAAETGVNDAVEVIKASGSGAIPEKTSCEYSGPDYDASKANIDPANNVSYTCLLVTTGVSSLRKSLDADGTSVAMPLHPSPSSGGSIGTLKLKWTLPDAPATVPCAGSVTGTLNPSNLWTCPYGVVRMDFVQENNYSRAAMQTSLRTVFLYPITGGSTPNHALAGLDGDLVGMYCTTSGCTADISGFAPSPNGNYFMRVMALYVGGNMELTAANGATPVVFNDAQAQIDVTGKAQDVLRRIQVRVPINTTNPPSNYGIESASSVCKRFGIIPAVGAVPGIFRNQITTAQDTRNPYCQSF
jgi:Tfp pilus assembly protein PilX